MTTAVVSAATPAGQPGQPATDAQSVGRVEALIRQFYHSYQVNRRWYQFSSAVQLVLAAAIPVIAVLDLPNYKFIAAACGAAIAIAKGVQESFGVYQNWVRQAQVYKELQAELDMYNARAGDYQTGDATRLLVTRTTNYVLDENKAWADSAKQPPAQSGGN